MDINEIVPTIMVTRNGVECVINETDFDPATDKRDAAPADKPKRSPKAAPADTLPTAAPPVQLGVTNIDGRFYVVNLSSGEKVTLDGIDEKGYDDDTAAIAAAREAMK